MALAHSLSGSPTDNYRHAVVRSAFMAELCTHPRVIDAFNGWGVETGIFAALEALLAAGDAVASRLNLPNRAALNTPAAGDAIAALDSRARRRLERLAVKYEKASEQLGRRVKNGIRRLGPAAEALVRDLLRPGWPWVSWDLTETFANCIEGCAVGASEGVRTVWVADPAPKVSMTFATHENEDRATAIQRLTAEYLAAFIKLAQQPSHGAKKGRLPRAKGHATLTRDARWYYRHHVLGVPTDELAREYCATAGGYHQGRDHTWRNDRRTVSDGINNAVQLLGEIPQYAWRD
ncbi:MAG: hypothetical protein AB1689_12425 [Thermodesulfobacteriota bacterium]